jgi:rhodanese-related sulfurtransferase
VHLQRTHHSLRTMSKPITISNLSYIHPTALAAIISDPSKASSTAIIDVRDSDHIGGHIKGSIWIPVPELDARMPELLRIYKGKEKVVFHCMLSQQRGPQSALKFARAKEAHEAKEKRAQKETDKVGDADSQEQEGSSGPEVCVLEGGFGAWQARYGEDEKLTEGYVKDIWE